MTMPRQVFQFDHQAPFFAASPTVLRTHGRPIPGRRRRGGRRPTIDPTRSGFEPALPRLCVHPRGTRFRRVANQGFTHLRKAIRTLGRLRARLSSN